MSELKEKLISNEANMAQKLPLQVEYDTFADGEKLLVGDLQELGLEEDTNHMKIEFDNDKSAKYCFCRVFLIMLSTVYGLPVFLLTFPCIWYNTKVWAKSRLAAVTDNKLVMKEGYYGCCCCCYNEKTKSVPLDKITDLKLEQGCIQKCYNIQGIAVETASSMEGKPEMGLVGLYKPRAVRSMILKVRDNHGFGTLNGGKNNGTPGANPLLPQSPMAVMETKQLEDLVTQQHQTMIEIKDVLEDMKTALVSMDQKMSGNNPDLQ
eukprot:CAMPEP_0201566824 /NCGR_PEP_ID=MMETSP0190_2-20130828/6912_1 /ASSEMBLY_ACC=CAM_ASM_000263 /TAXON_ID=37353 /ORGANISM="Rosalina sp." /LENGTH=263 /DNA_ID=CAMNT_0047986063 /DNA_START=18 /DNA_END=809 /DNA_ORIENTATION=-